MNTVSIKAIEPERTNQAFQTEIYLRQQHFEVQVQHMHQISQL